MKICQSNLTPLEILSKQEQLLHSPDLYAYVKNPNTQVNASVKLVANQLNIIMKQGILRCHTRVIKGDIDENTHTPLFVPKESKIS